MNAPRCPLCEAANSCSGPVLDVTHVIEKLGLGGDLDVLLNSDTPIPNPPLTRLITCECGFEFFWPNITATGDFYARLERLGGYYTETRWDHQVALGELAGAARVTDFGSGSGTFLRTASELGLDVAGVDLNPTRPIDLPAQVTVVHGAMQDLPAIAEALPKADVVTAFQVLEHVADPIGMLQGLAALAVDRGLIIVSVPNRDRFEVDGTQPLDCPPHHQTRWRKRDLEGAALRARLVPIRVVTQYELNPVRLIVRLLRRAAVRHPAEWPLPSAARPWPPSHLIKGQNLVAVMRRS